MVVNPGSSFNEPFTEWEYINGGWMLNNFLWQSNFFEENSTLDKNHNIALKNQWTMNFLLLSEAQIILWCLLGMTNIGLYHDEAGNTVVH